MNWINFRQNYFPFRESLSRHICIVSDSTSVDTNTKFFRSFLSNFSFPSLFYGCNELYICVYVQNTKSVEILIANIRFWWKIYGITEKKTLEKRNKSRQESKPFIQQGEKKRQVGNVYLHLYRKKERKKISHPYIIPLGHAHTCFFK